MQDTFDQAQKIIDFLIQIKSVGQNEQIDINDLHRYKDASESEKGKLLIDYEEIKKMQEALSNNKEVTTKKRKAPNLKLF